MRGGAIVLSSTFAVGGWSARRMLWLCVRRGRCFQDCRQAKRAESAITRISFLFGLCLYFNGLRV